jgi:hypothetical protein
MTGASGRDPPINTIIVVLSGAAHLRGETAVRLARQVAGWLPATFDTGPTKRKTQPTY